MLEYKKNFLYSDLVLPEENYEKQFEKEGRRAEKVYIKSTY